MKQFNRASLPAEIKYNGDRYYCLGPYEESLKEHQHTRKYKFVCVSVLQRNLKGREDLHGKQYQPRPFLYGCLLPKHRPALASYYRPAPGY